MIVTVAIVADPVKVDIVVEICVGSSCKGYPRNGQVFTQDGMAAMGRADGLTIDVRTVTDMSSLPGGTPHYPAVSVDQLRGITLELGAGL